MSLVQELIGQIDAYITRRGIKETTFGRLAVDDGKFVGRLRAGKGVTVGLLERARQYMADNAAPESADAEEEPAETHRVSRAGEAAA